MRVKESERGGAEDMGWGVLCTSLLLLALSFLNGSFFFFIIGGSFNNKSSPFEMKSSCFFFFLGRQFLHLG